MRNAFASELNALAKGDERVVLLSGDIGNRLFDSFKEICPDRFFNCGVAESNMMSMAAGMALSGLRPITYTITPFNTLRCLEQIKIDVCYHNAQVVIVGTGAGLSYAGLGATHHSLEDIAIMRTMPNMTILCPGDAVEVRLALRAALSREGPVYVRIGKKNEPIIHKETPKFKIGKGLIIQEGSKICLFSTGNMLPIALEVAESLAQFNLSTRVVSMHTIKPLDTELLAEAFGHYEVISTLEEHSLIGGFGSSVAEWLSDQAPQKGSLCRIGLDDCFIRSSGNQENARKMCGLTSQQIAMKIRSKID